MHRRSVTTVSFIMIIMTALALSACVTINIYFPAAAAERAADRIIDEVWQLKPDAKPAVKPDTAKPATPQ
jgi:hypothetical protein